MRNIFTRKSRHLLWLGLLTLICFRTDAQPGPGGVSGASVWLRGDQGVTATGTNISAWVNQAGAPNFTGNGNPQLAAGNINFNPGIVFSGSNYLTSAATVLPANSAYTKFVVFKYDGATANNIISSGAGGSNAFFGNNTNTNLVIFHNGTLFTAANAVNTTRYYLGVAGFSSGTAAGTFISVDGTTKASGTFSASYTASAMQLGAHVNGNNLTGRIAEVIVFPAAIGNNSVSTRKVESYLGIKYGIPLGHDYFASDGTTTYSISSFAGNVAGIGRDDNSALNQKQSKSLNIATSQVVMALGSAAATNSANSNTFAGDKQFLIWGDNNGAITTTAALSGWTTATTRLTRIWKLQNTGSFNQQVTVYFPASSLNVLPGTNPYLIYNTSSTLAGGGTEVPATTTRTIDGVAYTGFAVTFPAAGPQYFSFAAKTIYPGNVAGASVWLRPEAGVASTGTSVTGWTNQVNGANSFTGTGNPQFTAGHVNYNPAITFNGSNYLTSAATALAANSNYTKFVVFKYDAAAANNIISSGTGGNNAFFGGSTNTDLNIFHAGTILTAANVVNGTRYFIGTGGHARGVAAGTFINVDGTLKTSINSSANYVASTMQIGAHTGTSNLTGRVAEVIVYPSSLGTASTATRQIESYLGLKYGITVGHDYIASDGTTTTYSISGFANNIAGIGRDDNTALNQRQSKSLNTTTSQVIMAIGTIAATNAVNANIIAADNQFLIWGDNNGSIGTTTALTGWASTTTRLARIWKLQNTNSFSQQVTVYFPVSSLNALPGTNPYLIYNTSNTLAGGGTEVPVTQTTTIGGVAYKGYAVTFPATGTLYFSFAAKSLNPGNVAGASVWVRADAGINTTGTNVNTWTNQMSAANSFTAAGAPQFSANNVNFNPGISLGTGNYLATTATILAANSAYTKFVVFKYDGAALANNVVSSGTGGTNAFWGSSTNTELDIYHAGNILTTPNSITPNRYYLGVGGFASGVTSGTYINVDGTTKGTATSSAPYTAATLQLGAQGPGNYLNGRIAEAIVYPSSLGATSAATRQIESYLGLKYGISVGHDYIASDGTTTTYTVSGFANNIAGIGRDDNTDLNQVQSQSLGNGSNSQIVMALGSVEATNADNNNAIAADNQFLIWGDNNGSITTTTNVTGFTTVNNRFTRVWKLQNTNSFNQQVTVYFPTADLNLLTNSAKYLIYNTSVTLAGPGTEVPATTTATIGGTAYTGFVVTFPTTNTLYFSFASKSVFPGNVSGPSVWVRADAGVNATGSTITSWINQANTSNNFTATNAPAWTNGAINFNPSVTFDAAGYFTSAANVPAAANSNYSKFVVFRAPNVLSNNLLSAANGAPGAAMYASGQALRMLHNGITVGASAANSINPGRLYLGTQLFNTGVTNGTFIRINGTNSVTTTSSTAYGVDRLQIGAYNSTNTLGAGANITEAVVYNTALSTANTRQVESYLALKYGLTLGADYLVSDGSTNYTISGYGTNIAGIGRDDNTALDQRQSQSANPGSQVVMSAGTIAAANDANTASITTDKQFLIWGDNDAAGYNYNTGISQKRLKSTWQLQNTNSFNQAVTVYYPVTGLYGLGNNPMLVYGTLASLDDGSATQVSVGDNVTINGEAYRSFSLTFPVTATQYFSFAGQIVPEICGNGIDDDLDEYIDELDAGCTPVPTCIAAADPLTNFAIRQDWVTATANALATSASPTVADLNGDGLPEILTVRAGGTGITYFKGNGSDKTKNTIDYNIQLPVRVNQSTMQAAVADVDRDGVPEVMVVGDDGYVYVFNNISGSASNYKYRSSEVVSSRFANGSPRITDINEDGVPEIVVGLDVFQFNFGEGRLVKAVIGSATAPCGQDGVNPEWADDVVVVDILPANPGKEIVAGSQVYGVNLTTGVTTVLANLSTIAGTSVIPANDDGPTAVADLDNDGSLDIAYPNGSHMIVWNPASGTLKMKVAYNPPANGAALYRGQPTIANVYDEQTIDGKATNLPEIIFTVSLKLQAFNLNKTTGPVWSLITTDNSGETGVTAFDLNGDGVQEIIYNDEDNIRVINGNRAAPVNVATFASGTGTWMEHPVVVDVDNDGGAEFVCVTNGSSAFTGMLRVFGPAAGTSPWQNTRKLWNGRGYRPKSINDDLTIPVKEQNIMVQYPPASGKYPIDVYNCQIDAKLLSPGITAVSDILVTNVKIANSDVACTFNSGSATISYTLSNNGSAAAPAGTQIRFYKGNPAVAGSVRLAARDSLLEGLAVGASIADTAVLNLSAQTPPYTVYVVVNDNGTSAIPFTMPVISTNVKECDYTNNISSVTVAPLPSDFGNLSGTWPDASAIMPASDAAWLGINVPTAECATNVSDNADGLVMTGGALSGNGNSASPWLVSGINSVCNFTLTVNGSGTAKPVYWGLWFDVDGNGNFTDADDIFITDNLTHGSPVATSFNIVIPGATGATSGAIRVIGTAVDPSFTKDMNGTGTFTNGEVEDYYISYASPLPVTLKDFSASVTGKCTAGLEWSTSTEHNSDRYEIQRSSNGQEFQLIGSVKSNNRTAGSRYTFTDNNTLNGRNYYRLSMVDNNGSYQYSNTVVVTATCQNASIQVVPNPVTSIAIVTGLEGGEQIRIIGIDGRIELEQSAETTTARINMSVLPNGIHLLQVLRNGVLTSSIKLTKL